MNDQVLYVHEIPALIERHALSPELWGHTLLLLGPTGVGKTESIRQGLLAAAQVMGRELRLHELHLSQLGPVDALGVPRERQGRTYWAPPEIWPLAAALDGHDAAVTAFLDHYCTTGKKAWDLLPREWYVHFHDEVTNAATPQVPHQLFPVWCGTSEGRILGGQPLVKDFFVILAGNRVEDGTNSFALANSAVSRLTIIQVQADFQGWIKHYALQPELAGGQERQKIHPRIVAFLMKMTQHFAPNPAELKRGPMEPFPTPRAWKFVSDLFYEQDTSPMPENLFRMAVAGRIGPAAADLFAFLQYASDLPDLDAILATGQITNWPDPEQRPDLLFIISTELVQRLNEKTAKTIMKILLDDRLMPGEYSARTLQLIGHAGKILQLAQEWAKDEFRAWTRKHEKVMF